MKPCNVLECLEALVQNGEFFAGGRIDRWEYFRRLDKIRNMIEKDLNENCPAIKQKENKDELA